MTENNDFKVVDFWPSLYSTNRGPNLQIRAVFTKPTDIKKISMELLEKRTIYFIAKISFRDELSARLRLKELGFI